MVLETKPNSTRGKSVHFDYIVYIQEIKPWPPSHSLRSLDSVFLHWKYADRISGFTRAVIPSIGSGVGDGKLKFHESFKLPVSQDIEAYRNNHLELNLYESQKDKTAKDQLLATVVVDLVKYQHLKKTVAVNSPMNFKKGLRTTTQPVLCIKIQPMNKHSAYSLSRFNLSEGAALDKNGGEYMAEPVLPSDTDADESTRSSTTIATASDSTEGSPIEESALEIVMNSTVEPALSKNGQEKEASTVGIDGVEKDVTSNNKRILDRVDLARQVYEKIVKGRNKFKENVQQLVKGNNNNNPQAEVSLSEVDLQESEKTGLVMPDDHFDTSRGENNKARRQGSVEQEKNGLLDRGQGTQLQGKRWEEESRKEICHMEDRRLNKFSADGIEELHNTLTSAESVQSQLGSGGSNASVRNRISREHIKEIDVLRDSSGSDKISNNCAKKNMVDARKEITSSFSSGKVQQLKCRIEKLERELQEAAAVEMSIYSVVAEHGSSINKLYAPVRRLSRLYFHACRHDSAARRASAAKSAVSGLVLVAKSCGNDVPRLTFWLSNSVALRVSISKVDENLQQQVPSVLHIEANATGKRSSSMKKVSGGDLFGLTNNSSDWEDPRTFTAAMETIEAWIFSRVVESVWWQTFTPHMQSAAGKAIKASKVSRKEGTHRTKPISADQDQANFSLELWKKVFRDACEKLCPVRGGGHTCACLPVLSRLIMEQCLSRLDVAMFNALLRESSDMIPTDPVSDPVSNSKVLPIPVGKSSFGTGAQLKNIIWNWSRWLSDHFGILDNVSKSQSELMNEDERNQSEAGFKFHYLNALSDLMMLPKDMLLNKLSRKEVCPTFSAPVIKRILTNFVPDEFCSDQIPQSVFSALSEDLKDDKESVRDIPCNAAPVVYLPPAVISSAIILQVQSALRRNKSHCKSYTSDDELDEVNSPLSSILFDKFRASAHNWKSKDNRGGSSVRYQLLREIWCNVD